MNVKGVWIHGGTHANGITAAGRRQAALLAAKTSGAIVVKPAKVKNAEAG